MPRTKVTPTPLGNHIIRRRKIKGWNTADLARETGLSYSTVRNIEKGMSRKPDERILRALIKALDCDEGVVFAFAGYGTIPTLPRDQIIVSLDELGDAAPLWRDAIERLKVTMTPEQLNQAYAVLKAQIDGASSHR